ncbi:MAG: STAS domain-containing protein [Xanthobacteraceae bacterium]|jgi:anti-sigma B factor antagonist
MDISQEHTGDVTIVEVKGRIDSNSAKTFGDRLNNLIKTGRARIIVDLKDIVYVSSAGFRALLLAARNAEEKNGTIALCNVSSEVRRLFDLARFTDLFPIYSSREEGVAKLS